MRNWTNQKEILNLRLEDELTDAEIDDRISFLFQVLRSQGYSNPFLRECENVVCYDDYVELHNPTTNEILFLVQLRCM